MFHTACFTPKTRFDGSIVLNKYRGGSQPRQMPVDICRADICAQTPIQRNGFGSAKTCINSELRWPNGIRRSSHPVWFSGDLSGPIYINLGGRIPSPSPPPAVHVYYAAKTLSGSSLLVEVVLTPGSPQANVCVRSGQRRPGPGGSHPEPPEKNAERADGARLPEFRRRVDGRGWRWDRWGAGSDAPQLSRTGPAQHRVGGRWSAPPVRIVFMAAGMRHMPPPC